MTFKKSTFDGKWSTIFTENCGFLMDEGKKEKFKTQLKPRKFIYHIRISHAQVFFSFSCICHFLTTWYHHRHWWKTFQTTKKNTVKFVKTKPFLFIVPNTTAQMKLINSIKKDQSAFQNMLLKFSHVKSSQTKTTYLQSWN